MTPEEKILKGIRMLGGGNEKTFLASVENNYPDKDYIDVKDLSGTLYPEVRKRAAIGTGEDAKKGIVITPASGSTVIVSRIGDSDELFVEMFSEVESIVIDGGENGGLTITPKLVQELNKNNELLQAIITVLSGAPIPEPGNASPSALQAALKIAITDKQLGDYSEIENTKIKH
ncbi:MAG TPA: hypothetical protein VIK29_11985 [Paludibacter sp.]